MSQQPALQPQEFPVQRQQQQSERYQGSGGGGGGGHRPDGDYSPEEVAHIFEQLAQVTRNGDLRAGLPKLVDGSAATRSEALHNVTTRSITKGTPPAFDESDSSRPRPAVQGTGLTARYSTSELCGNLSRKYSE